MEEQARKNERGVLIGVSHARFSTNCDIIIIITIIIIIIIIIIILLLLLLLL